MNIHNGMIIFLQMRGGIIYNRIFPAHRDDGDVASHYVEVRIIRRVDYHTPNVLDIIFREFYYTFRSGLSNHGRLVDNQSQEEEAEAYQKPHQDNPLCIFI